MNIKLDLLKKHISNHINKNLKDFDIDADKIVDTDAIKILSEIQKVICDEDYSDFEAIEAIVCIFEEYKIDFGARHDFG